MRKRRKNRNVSVPNRRINRWQQISSLKDAAIITECLGKRKKQIVYVFEYGFVCKAPEPAWNKGWSDWNSYEKFFLKRKEFALQVTPAHKNGKEQSGVRCHFCGAWLRALFVFGELSACAYQRFAETRSHTKCENGVWGSPTSKRIGGRLDGDALLATAVFPDSSLSWEQRKLGDCFEFLQNNTLSRAELTSEQGVALNVHYGDVLIKFGEYLDASTEEMAYIPNQAIVDKFKGSFLADGDIVMADTAEDETVGKCSEIAGLQGRPAISGLHTIPLRPVRKFASGFLGYYMNSGAYHDQLLPLMQGIKVTSVSKNAIRNTDISYPSDTTEQAAIGQYFIRLDTLITLHQREHAA